MSLADVYQNALEDRYKFPRGWMANWPPGFDQSLGVVGRIEDGMITYGSTLADKEIPFEPDPNVGDADGAWTFESDSDIGIEFAFDASTPGCEWIGNAKAGVKIGFGKNDSVVLGIGSTHQERILNIDGLKPLLLAAAEDGRLEVGQSVIVEKQVADSGLQATSQGSNAMFEATTNADVGPAGAPSLASFGLDLNVHQESRSVSTESYPHGFTVAFRVLNVGRRGFWWWKHIVIDGIEPVKPEDTEEFLSDDDYFALLPAART